METREQVMERTERQLIDDWLEAAYESRVNGDYEEPFSPLVMHTLDFDEEDEEEGDHDCDEPSTNGVAPSKSNGVAPLQQKIDHALEVLAAQLADGHTDAFHELIRFYSRFHHYSLANTILIQQQKPDAIAVAGYVRWKQLKRQVRRDAKSAHIWCPVKIKVEDENCDEDIRMLAGYKTCYVFSDKDLVDAETNPVPVGRPAMPDNYSKLLSRLMLAVVDSGVAVKYVEHLPGAEGMYRRGMHQIVLVEGRDSHNQVLILLHEWAHALFHHEVEAATWPEALKEFQAETVAMVMGEILGVPSPYANDYLLTYGVTPTQLKFSIGHIHSLVTQMSQHLKLASTAL
jgi:hypothetical protein